MDDLATYLFDLTQNAIRAKAKYIQLTMQETENALSIVLKDDGCGMDEASLKQATSPYFTTRQTRKVGLGLSMIEMIVKQTEGSYHLDSRLGEGTTLTMTFHHHHIDMPPMGDLGELIMMISIHHEVQDFTFTYLKHNNRYQYSLSEIKNMFGTTINTYSVMDAMTHYINQEINKVRG